MAAYLRQIPDTDWAMVSKVDEDEIYAPVRQIALWTSAVTLLLLGASFAVFWVQMRRAQLAARNRQLRLEKKMLTKRFEDLTDLPNRTLFTVHLCQAMAVADRHQKLVGVMFMDLDHFKNINDTLGHEVGVEALIRWERPGKGMVSPAEFIPVAEESGLIVPIGEWVLRTACAQAKAWQDQGLPKLLMAVNLSSRQFVQGHLVELVKLVKLVKTVLQETGLSPQCLELEITESILMDGADSLVLSTLNEFKQMGITLAIDDFGTGYSSLSYLRRFPVDKLKIDQFFVRGLPHNSEDASIVQTIIAMGRNLQLTVIAEGVETGEQHDYLHDHDCDQMQGYFFSRPLPAERLGDLLRKIAP